MCAWGGGTERHMQKPLSSLPKAHGNWKAVFIKRKKKRANKPPSKFCFACAIEYYILLFPYAFLVLSSTTCRQKLFEQITGFFSLFLACIQTTAPHTVDLSPLGRSGVDVASMTH